MIETLRELDEQLFLYLNGLHNEVLDTIMYWITYKYTWFPLYFLILALVIWKYRWPGLLMMLAVLLAVGLSDQLTSGFMKPYFGRLRPCHNPELQGMVHVVGGCGGQYGFASSHASTTFGLSMSLWLMMRGWSRIFIVAFLWSALVAYSRIYVGVHYPIDILIGATAGMAVGWMVFFLYCLVTRKLYGMPLYSRTIEEKRSPG